MGTVSIQTTDELVNDTWHSKTNRNRQTAIVIITHDTGEQETAHVLSNAAIQIFNDWIDAGYTPLSEAQEIARD